MRRWQGGLGRLSPWTSRNNISTFLRAWDQAFWVRAPQVTQTLAQLRVQWRIPTNWLGYPGILPSLQSSGKTLLFPGLSRKGWSVSHSVLVRLWSTQDCSLARLLCPRDFLKRIFHGWSISFSRASSLNQGQTQFLVPEDLTRLNSSIASNTQAFSTAKQAEGGRACPTSMLIWPPLPVWPC